MPDKELEKVYDPKKVEEKWTKRWEKDAISHADAQSEKPSFSIVIPPPNVTGSLHLGHALNSTLQDILSRWHRMRGDNVLWLPGMDHAGIATQNVVERRLAAEGGMDRHALGRKGFIAEVKKWKEESGGTILNQLKRLGASCDWERERFTMDPGPSRAVTTVFEQLYKEGLIYRDQRLINLCPHCRTALSDIEVEHEDIEGKMYYIKYPLADDPTQFLTVATTRPETMLGDTAVAVHPKDPRFNHFIGKKIKLPLTTREIPIIGDPILVDREKGTGAVKITPGHDFNDEKSGKRNKLEKISLIDWSGEMEPLLLHHAQVEPELAKLLSYESMKKAREIVVKALEKAEMLTKTEKNMMSLGKCYRCKSVVEPFDSPQWFVKVNAPGNSLAQAAIDAVREKKIRLIPESWEANYFGWMENIEDWCISRQIWWGHQVPVFYCKTCDQQHILEVPSSHEMIIASEATPIVGEKSCSQCGGSDLLQDPDVLDTWFSSALWPFSTLGWPADQQPDEAAKQEAKALLKRFYPTSTLVSGFDILFFWVARMIMMGLHFMKDVPFKDVYIHALVRDANGQKMSKSKGNVINPLDLMDKYGTDALRFTLAAMASPGRDIKLSEARIEGYRNFCNKLWNVARFILMNRPEDIASLSKTAPQTSANRWIQSRLNQ
ncbi:MAG: valine--tRNA ligase, partial [Nitrospirae bacterium]|nr:valine--tRNA ligase [Candidatus Manganitrophaceae bacterium]